MIEPKFSGIMRRLKNSKIENKEKRKENFRKFIKNKNKEGKYKI